MKEIIEPREVILDFGSGETAKNDKAIVKDMIDAIVDIDTHRNKIFFKWQLFNSAPAGSPKELKPLSHNIFDFAYWYAKSSGYETSASFFDDWSYHFLLLYDVPWLKLACREHLYKWIERIDPGRRLIISVPSVQKMVALDAKYGGREIRYLMCIPEYPANPIKYETMFWENLSVGISDHSPDMRLWHRYHPWTYERHYKLEDSTGLDAGPHASTPEQLKEIL